MQVGAELFFRVLGCKSKRITVTHKKTLVCLYDLKLIFHQCAALSRVPKYIIVMGCLSHCSGLCDTLCQFSYVYHMLSLLPCLMFHMLHSFLL